MAVSKVWHESPFQPTDLPLLLELPGSQLVFGVFENVLRNQSVANVGDTDGHCSGAVEKQMFVSGVADARLSTTTNCESENDNLKCESEDGCVFNLLEIEEESNLSFEGAACARLGKEKPQQILDPVDCLPVNLDSSLSRSNMSKTIT